MRPETRISNYYAIFDRLIKVVEHWLTSQEIEYRDYSKEIVSTRLAQAIVCQSIDLFMEDSPQRWVKDDIPQVASFGGVRFNTSSGKVSLHIKLWSTLLAKFIALWSYCLLVGVRSVFNKKENDLPAVILYGVPETEVIVEGSDRRFLDYCRTSPIKELAEAQRIVVELYSPIEPSDVSFASYSRFPLASLALSSGMRLAELVKFIYSHIASLIAFLKASFIYPVSALLWQDIAMHACAESLNRRGLIKNVLYTNTNWLQQPLWMTDLTARQYGALLVLYSLNTYRLMFKGESKLTNHPGMRHVRADQILIWEKDYERFLEVESLDLLTRIVPPVVWYQEPDALPIPPDYELRICVFDITPNSAAESRRRGMEGEYHSRDTLLKFIQDVVECSDFLNEACNMPCRTLIKHKRDRRIIERSDLHYLDKVESLVKGRADFELISKNINLFELIAGCHLIIVIPYSSPAYIASYLKTPAIFHDPTGQLLHNFPLSEYVVGSSSTTELKQLALKNITKYSNLQTI